MSIGLPPPLMQALVSAAPEQQRQLLTAMTPQDLLRFDADFECWAHDGQRPPPGEGWRVWLMLAGRGFGKTRAGAEWIHGLASRRRGLRIALVGANIAEARSIMVEGVSGILSVAGRNNRRVKWEPSLAKVSWSSGSEAQLFSGDNGDGLRGPEHDFAWCDELAKWRDGEAAWMNLQMGLRRGTRPRALVTTTPSTTALLKRIRDDAWTVPTGGRTKDNVTLDERFFEIMAATYGGTRLGRQELDGELIEEPHGALWTPQLIEASRTLPPGHPSALRRTVVGVDPPAGTGANCDACGIVVCASGHDGLLYVLADESVQGLSPEGWANRVASAAARWGTRIVVAEANNGGAMVKSVIEAADAALKVRLVHASAGKSARAEPVALKFEKGTAKLAGHFPELEAELAGLIAGGGYEGPVRGSHRNTISMGSRSPDRADAMVWALTDLMQTRSGVPRVARL